MRVLVTGGAGYIGSLLSGVLLAAGHEVTAVDVLLFGGESLLSYLVHPAFRFQKADVCGDRLDDHLEGIGIVYHLAGIVGFPACRHAGEERSYRCNTTATQHVFEACERAGVERFVFASTYSNYGVSWDDRPVTEESPLHPQSLYARTKIAAERWLLARGQTSRCAPVILRFATLFGISPRTRFDLMLNQFVMEAFRNKRLLVYQPDHFRSFVHVRDVAAALLLIMEGSLDLIRNQIFNLGAEGGNHSKRQIAGLVLKHVGGDVCLEYRDTSFSEDTRDVRVSFEKIRRVLGFVPQRSVEDGVVEVLGALKTGLIPDPTDSRYWNCQPLIS